MSKYNPRELGPDEMDHGSDEPQLALPTPRHLGRPWFERRTEPGWCRERLHWWISPEDAKKCCHPDWRRVTLMVRGHQAFQVPGRWIRR